MACEEKCFAFTWRLENIIHCVPVNGYYIISPFFVVDSIVETKWRLVLYPNGDLDYEDYISFYLHRYSHDNGDNKVSVKFELAFLAQDGCVLTSKSLLVNFSNHGHGFSDFEKREDVFLKKRLEFLPQDTLTARCRIWKSEVMTEDVRCFARTRIGIEKRSHLWRVENFSNLHYGQKYTYEVKSLDHEKQLITVNLYLSEGLDSDATVCFDVNLHDQTVKFSSLLLYLVFLSGKKIECNREEFLFHDSAKSKEFKFFYTKNKLVEMKSMYLPKDILSLHFEWVFSRGVISNIIEDVQYTCTDSGDKSVNSLNVNSLKITPLSYPLNDNLKSLYDRNFLCDVKLKTSTHEFNAHKLILSASSSVFEAMFSCDMAEKNSNDVSIEDLSDDTISQMLEYIYTARIDNLTWERASLLYEAADKYAILSLKTICSSYLKDNLSPTNVCEVLLLSDLHFDDEFKSSVQDYILKHLKETVKSVGWAQLMKTYPTLAAETLILPYK